MIGYHNIGSLDRQQETWAIAVGKLRDSERLHRFESFCRVLELITMFFQGFDKQQGHKAWQPFFDWIADLPIDLKFTAEPRIWVMPARILFIFACFCAEPLLGFRQLQGRKVRMKIRTEAHEELEVLRGSDGASPRADA